MAVDQCRDLESRNACAGAVRRRLRLFAYGVGLWIGLLVVGWAGTGSSAAPGVPGAEVVARAGESVHPKFVKPVAGALSPQQVAASGRSNLRRPEFIEGPVEGFEAVPHTGTGVQMMIASLANMGCTPGEAYAFGQSAVATITPTVTVTPIATDQYSVFLPLIEKQVVIPGSLSIEDVYTTDYEGDRQMTYQPCQAVALWTRMRNEADIPQPAILHWRTMAPTEEEHGNLGGRRQVYVPPGESVWRFLGAPDLDAPAGEYQWQAWFTSGIDRHGLEGTIIVEGQSVPTRYLEALTAKIDPENYTFTVSRVIVPGRAYATYPARPADVFTPEDDFVVQTILWEGVKPDTAIFTRRYRPSGRPWGNANYGFRGYETHPGCVRRQNLYWHVEDMEDKPGEWRLKFSTDEGSTWQGALTFTLTE